MGGRPSTRIFSTPEKRAFYDFTARFTPSDTPERRLNAVEELTKLDKSYDATIARAMILFQAEKKRAALEALKKARKNGRDDAVLRRFIQFLQQ